MLAMWIVFGTRTVDREWTEGTFHCDECGEAPYSLHKVRRMFHVLFIPLFAVRELDEYVRCQRCDGIYKSSVLPKLPAATVAKAPPAPEKKPAADALERKLDDELDRFDG